MAKGRKAAAAAPGRKKIPKAVAAEGAPPKEQKATTFIKASKLNSLLADSRKAYKEQRGISGELGASIKEAAEHDHLHKKSFATIRALDRMEPEKLADWFAHFDYMAETTGLRKRAGSVMRMPLGDDEEETEPAASINRAANVKPFPMPVGNAAE